MKEQSDLGKKVLLFSSYSFKSSYYLLLIVLIDTPVKVALSVLRAVNA